MRHHRGYFHAVASVYRFAFLATLLLPVGGRQSFAQALAQPGNPGGARHAVDLLRAQNAGALGGRARLDRRDGVRHPLVGRIVAAYDGRLGERRRERRTRENTRESARESDGIGK